jgi:hypothetical protein
MSHIGNGEDDLKDLDRMNLDDDVKRAVEQARIEARGIIDRLEPRHIDGWPSLILVLEDCLENAKRNAEIFQHISRFK